MWHTVTLIILLGRTIDGQPVSNAHTYGLGKLPPITNRFRAPQWFVKPMLQHQEFHSGRSIFAPQAESLKGVELEEYLKKGQANALGDLLKDGSEPEAAPPSKSEEGLMEFEASITGNPIMGEKIETQEFSGSQWEKGVRNLNPEKKKGDAPGPFLKIKEATQRQIGKQCSEQDLQQATKDLSGLAVDDVAAILRKDGTWTYAKLILRVDPGEYLPPETTPEPDQKYDYTYKLPLAAMHISSMNSAVALIGFFVGSGVMFAVLQLRRGVLPAGKNPLLTTM